MLARALDAPAAKKVCIDLIDPIAPVATVADLLRVLERVSPGYALPKPADPGHAIDYDLAQVIVLLERARTGDARASSMMQAKAILDRLTDLSDRGHRRTRLTLLSSVADVACDLGQPAVALAICASSCKGGDDDDDDDLASLSSIECAAGRCLVSLAGNEPLSRDAILREAVRHLDQAVQVRLYSVLPASMIHDAPPPLFSSPCAPATSPLSSRRALGSGRQSRPTGAGRTTTLPRWRASYVARCERPGRLPNFACACTTCCCAGTAGVPCSRSTALRCRWRRCQPGLTFGAL